MQFIKSYGVYLLGLTFAIVVIHQGLKMAKKVPGVGTVATKVDSLMTA